MRRDARSGMIAANRDGIYPRGGDQLTVIAVTVPRSKSQRKSESEKERERKGKSRGFTSKQRSREYSAPLTLRSLAGVGTISYIPIAMIFGQ